MDHPTGKKDNHMKYNTGHTARFLVSFFLNRKHSLKYKLSGPCRGILRYLADAIDIEFYKSGERCTTIGIKQICIYSGFSDKTVRSSIHFLIKKRIVQKLDHEGGWSSYWLGIIPTLYALRKGKLSTGAVKRLIECGNSYRTSNTIVSKLQTYNKGNEKDEQKNNRKLALHVLAKKLGKESELNH